MRGIEGTSFGPFMAARNGLDTTRENPTAVTGGENKEAALTLCAASALPSHDNDLRAKRWESDFVP